MCHARVPGSLRQGCQGSCAFEFLEWHAAITILSSPDWKTPQTLWFTQWNDQIKMKKGGSPCQSTPNSSSSFSCMALLSSCWTWMTWFQIQSKKCERYYYIYCIYIYVYNHHARFRASVWCLVLIEKTVSAIRQDRLATRKAIQNWQMKTSHFPLCRWLTSQKWTNCHGISMIVAGWNHLNSTQTNHINPILRFPKIVVPLNHQFS